MLREKFQLFHLYQTQMDSVKAPTPASCITMRFIVKSDAIMPKYDGKQEITPKKSRG